MEICGLHSLMMGGGMVFCEIIHPIAVTKTPKNMKLALVDAIMDPIKMHVNGFGAFLFDGVIGNATGHAVVSL